MNLEILILEIVLIFFNKIRINLLKYIFKNFILLINPNIFLNISLILLIHFKTVVPTKV